MSTIQQFPARDIDEYSLCSPATMKVTKATKACHYCRAMKQECDGAESCAECVAKGLPCTYSEPRGRSASEITHDLIELLKSSSAKVDALLDTMDGHSKRLDRIESETPATKSPKYRAAQPRQVVRRNRRYIGSHHLIGRWPAVDSLLKTANVFIDDEYVSRVETYSPKIQEDYDNSNEHDSLEQQSHPGMDAVKLDRLGLSNGYCGECEDCEGCQTPSRGHDLYPWQASSGQELFNSYVENMYVLHPILDLSGYLGECLAIFVQHSTSKRHCNNQAGSPRRAPLREAGYIGSKAYLRTIIAYLILALGEICICKQSNEKPQHQDLRKQSIGVTPPQSSRKRKLGEEGKTWNHHALQPDIQADACSASTPGMKYYARAAAMAGYHMDGNDILHAQIFVLAGLYKAQLGRVRESMNWICMASRICQMLLQSNDLLHARNIESGESAFVNHRRMQSQIKGSRHNTIVVTAWSCTQLESDILAQVPFPPSGIQEYGDLMPWPLLMPGCEAYEMCMRSLYNGKSYFNCHEVVVYYTAQLWLRRWLDRIQRQLYGEECLTWSHSELQNVLRENIKVLDLWRSSLPDDLLWNNEDKPAPDNLNSRLRETYWNACFVAHQPFLDYALHVMPGTMAGFGHESRKVEESAELAESKVLDLQSIVASMPSPEMWRGVGRCIEAAVQSIQALDGIEHSVIVTNIHGTAHSRFGSMLALIAAYDSPPLREFFIGVNVPCLLKRTISFLGEQAVSSRTCEIDGLILKQLLRRATNMAL